MVGLAGAVQNMLPFPGDLISSPQLSGICAFPLICRILSCYPGYYFFSNSLLYLQPYSKPHPNICSFLSFSLVSFGWTLYQHSYFVYMIGSFGLLPLYVGHFFTVARFVRNGNDCYIIESGKLTISKYFEISHAFVTGLFHSILLQWLCGLFRRAQCLTI